MRRRTGSQLRNERSLRRRWPSREIVFGAHFLEPADGALELEAAVAGPDKARRGSASAAASSFTLCS